MDFNLLSNDDLVDMFQTLSVDVENHPLNTVGQHKDATILQNDRNQLREIIIQRMK